MTATGTGLNLTRANVVLFAELNWVPGQLLQCEDRIHRLGQTCRSVRIIYVLAKGTGDEAMWEQVQKKHSVLDATVGICSDNKKAQHQKKPAQPSIATALMSYPTSNPSVASGRPVIQPQITGTVSTNTTRHVTQCSNRTGTGMTIDKRLSDKGLICGPSTVPFSDSAPTNNYHPNGNGIVGQSTLTSYFGLKQGSNQTVTDSSFVTGTSQNGQDSAQFSLFLSEGSKGNAGINPPVLNDISDATHMHSSPLKTVLSESKPSPELKRKIEASRQKALSLLKQKVVAPVGNLSHPENFSLHQSQTVNQKDTCRGQPSVKLSAVSERSNQLDVDLTNSETTVPPSNMKKIIEANRQLALEKLRAKNMLPQPIRPAAAHLEAKATDSGVVFQSGRGTKVAQVSGDKIAEVTRSMFS